MEHNCHCCESLHTGQVTNKVEGGGGLAFGYQELEGGLSDYYQKLSSTNLAIRDS